MSVDSHFLDIFPQVLVCGRTLEHPDEIIISESLAKKHFGHPEKALDVVLQQASAYGFPMLNASQLRIVGVMPDAPQNTTMATSGYYRTHEERIPDTNNPQEWERGPSITHLKLKKGVKEEDFQAHLDKAIGQMDFLKGMSFKVIPLHQKHFEFASEESFTYSAISMFTLATSLLLCCVLFNFMNLFLNRYYQRIREVKLRKSVGATTLKLLMQVMVEIMSYGVLGTLVCGCFIELGIPFFEGTFGISIPKADIIWEYFYLGIILLVVMQVLLLFPAWQFIRSVGKQALTGIPQSKGRNQMRRIGLATQLVICLFFLASASSLYRQLRFMNDTDLGFDTKHIVELVVSGFGQNGKNMLEDIRQLPMVERHTTTSQWMVSKEGLTTQNNYEWQGKTEDDQKLTFAAIELDKDADKMFNFRLKEGRTFTEEDWNSTGRQKDVLTSRPVFNKMLISESAARTMRLDHPIGEIIRVPLQLIGRAPIWTDYEIIGVVRDFHPQGMKAEPVPTLLFQSFRFINNINYFQVTPGTEEEFIKAIDRLAKKHEWNPEDSMNKAPQLLSDKMKNLNKSETATFRLFAILTMLCVLISLFGIFAISSTTIVQRRKEIAIRKVMGATAREVVELFFREYSWLVSVSAVVAFPFFYWVVSRWLEQYPYRVSVGAGMYVVLSGITILMVLLTVFRQVMRAANENPADVVKSE
jgi:ABC-type lipoprotein release transport system permease subunit